MKQYFHDIANFGCNLKKVIVGHSLLYLSTQLPLTTLHLKICWLTMSGRTITRWLNFHKQCTSKIDWLFQTSLLVLIKVFYRYWWHTISSHLINWSSTGSSHCSNFYSLLFLVFHGSHSALDQQVSVPGSIVFVVFTLVPHSIWRDLCC